ncbi:uncharacterized protein IL334_004945 [Kwoniella shivajii]|uniref:AGC protein kinase n=1 Tax=Kwoniella shivajii TaxID=564305 RepID=A0ABZ1D4S0_9TREE|nr:hypothetical protein IL334_004945 [Kwoniella shivajii]
MYRHVSIMDAVNQIEPEANLDRPQKRLSTSSSSSSIRNQHQPLYNTLAEYTLNSPRTFPIDPSLSSRNVSSSSRRPSSPLKAIEELRPSDQPGPFKGYTFPYSQNNSPSKENINMTAMAPSMSPTSSSTGYPSAGSSTGMISTAAHRLSVSGRPRRPSPLLHEIQPPSRRLSAHQMLLLTPFGGPLPAGALTGAGGMGMSRGSSSMGSSLPTAPPRLGSTLGQPSGFSRKDSGSSTMTATPNTAPSMGREAPPANRFPPRVRHSLANPVANPSPLASAPMTTIFSENSSDGTSSKGHSGHEAEPNTTFISRDEIGKALKEEREEPASPPRTRARLLSATVAMTRSNSLPVLTLRELHALKEKDGELGIQRGGDWAWVSREDSSEPEDAEMDTPGLETGASTNASNSTTSLTTPLEQPASSPSSSLYRNPFTAFQDPFAPRLAGSISIPTPIYAPEATAADYHYSPTGTGAELRRMSENPPVSSLATPPSANRGGRRSVTDGSRRPSAPTTLRQSFGGLTPKVMQRRTPPQLSQPIFQPTYQPLAPEETSPHGTPMAEAPPTRPRILRYKSSPGRFTGLGLNIVVRSTNSGNARGSGSDISPGGPGSAGAESRGSIGDQSTRAPSRSSLGMGHWAEVDFIDSLAATADIALASENAAVASASEVASTSAVSALGMSRTSSSISPTAVTRNLPTIRQSESSGSLSAISPNKRSTLSAVSAPATKTEYKIEHVASRSHLVGFSMDSEPIFKGRSRFESVDSAFPLMPGGNGERLSVPLKGAGESFAHRNPSLDVPTIELSQGFPRRGSLGMGTFARLRKLSGQSPNSQEQRSNKVDELGTKIQPPSNVISSSHWSERRGSWAEGWSNGDN